jgi:hypothetical protein
MAAIPAVAFNVISQHSECSRSDPLSIVLNLHVTENPNSQKRKTWVAQKTSSSFAGRPHISNFGLAEYARHDVPPWFPISPITGLIGEADTGPAVMIKRFLALNHQAVISTVICCLLHLHACYWTDSSDKRYSAENSQQTIASLGHNTPTELGQS